LRFLHLTGFQNLSGVKSKKEFEFKHFQIFNPEASGLLQLDAATVGARNWVLVFTINFLMIVKHENN
jgi:hypothetical protein